MYKAENMGVEERSGLVWFQRSTDELVVVCTFVPWNERQKFIARGSKPDYAARFGYGSTAEREKIAELVTDILDSIAGEETLVLNFAATVFNGEAFVYLLDRISRVCPRGNWRRTVICGLHSVVRSPIDLHEAFRRGKFGHRHFSLYDDIDEVLGIL